MDIFYLGPIAERHGAAISVEDCEVSAAFLTMLHQNECS